MASQTTATSMSKMSPKWGQINGLGSSPRDYNTDYTVLQQRILRRQDSMRGWKRNRQFIDYDPAVASDNLEDIGDVLQDALYATAYGAGALIELPVGAAQATSGTLWPQARALLPQAERPPQPPRMLYLSFSTADLALKLPNPVSKVATTLYTERSSGCGYGSDLVNAMAEYGDLGGMRATSLGSADESTADKLERYGENTTSFFKGAAKGLTPDVVQESFGDAVGSLSDKFNERPVLYTSLAVAAVPLLIPGVGGAYAKNVATGVGAAVGGLPKAVKAIAQLPGALIGGTVDGIKSASGSKPKSTAARRRARRRKR